MLFVFLRVWGTARFLMNADKNTPASGPFFLELLQVRVCAVRASDDGCW